MADGERWGSRHYGVEVNEGDGPGPRIEFHAEGPESALLAAQRLAADRNVTLYEDGRPLVRLRHASEGYWTIAPGPAAR